MVLILVLGLAIKVGDTVSDAVATQHDVVKSEKSEDTVKERPSKKNRKKEKEPVEKPSLKSRIQKRLLVLPFATSIVALFLLVLLGAFYVVI